VIEVILEALRNENIVTKRYDNPNSSDYSDIYYRDTVLFGNQKVVDRIVDLLAYTLLIPRSCLHVVWIFKDPSDAKVAAGKGLVSGHISFEMRSGVERIDCALSGMV
jgi:DNA topoisomerase VI subunit A